MTAALSSALAGVFSLFLGHSLLGADRYLASRLGSVASGAGDPAVLSGWFSSAIIRLLPGVELVALIATLVSAGMAAFAHGDPMGAVRSLVVAIPAVGIFSGVEIGVVALLVTASDSLAAFVFRAFAASAGHGASLGASLSGVQFPMLVGILLFGTYLVLALLLWLEIALRSAAIYMLCALLPFFAALAIYRGARVVLFRSLAALGALLVMKVLIGMGLGLSLAIASASVADPGQMVMAIACLLVSALSPLALVRLFSLEYFPGHDMERGARLAVRAASTASTFLGSLGSFPGDAMDAAPGIAAIPFAEGDPTWEANTNPAWGDTGQGGTVGGE
ncbi:MAG: hypothetical protein M0Z34_04070 [Nitrospiraceae bacterium]|nr:hypothetical protein [Nitrospiraceae bacterium]